MCALSTCLSLSSNSLKLFLFKGPCKSCRRFLIWKTRKCYECIITERSQNGTRSFRFQQHSKPRKEEERVFSVEKMICSFLLSLSRSPLSRTFRYFYPHHPTPPTPLSTVPQNMSDLARNETICYC